MLKSWLKDEQGAVLVFTALALVALLGVTALVTDVGLLYSSRSKLINAADAAALAGSQELPGDPAGACDVARDYLQANGVDSGAAQIEVGVDNCSLTVHPRRSVSLLFARVLGFYEQEVEAAATAAVLPLTAAKGVVPFCIEEQNLVYGEEYVLKEGAGKGAAEELEGSYHGWYGALDLDEHQGGGAKDYEERVKSGFEDELRVGDLLFIEAGNMSGPTTKGVAYRIGLCNKGCSFDSFHRGCPRLVVIPIIRVVDRQGGHPKTVCIQGFAAFFLERVEGQGADNSVVGRFVETVSAGEADEGNNYGLYGVRLIH